MKIPNISFNYPTYIVGGYVRDKIMNENSKPKDIDLCMVCDSIAEVESEIERVGGKVFISKPEYLTVRCKLPKLGSVDIAMARKDGAYTDARRPDSVKVASRIEEDLKRRDATMNAVAVDLSNGEIIDPFNGVEDIKNSLINAVGSAKVRIKEDNLRLLRYFRFAITKSFFLSNEIKECMSDKYYCDALEKNVSQERVREELFRCFLFDTHATLCQLEEYKNLRDSLFKDKVKSLWLKPTNESK